MSSLARIRLRLERKAWRKQHPFGFFAHPSKNEDGSNNLLRWKCGIAGKVGSAWEGGLYRLTMFFTEDFPNKPPTCKFDAVLWHPNVTPGGTVRLSILEEDKDWKPSMTIPIILVGIQTLLCEPNAYNYAQIGPAKMMKANEDEYWRRVREEATKYKM